jgi:hypothetical protein
VQNFTEEIHKVHKLGEPDTQKLIYSGKILKDDQTLDDAKIKDGGFVVLMTKKPDPKKDRKTRKIVRLWLRLLVLLPLPRLLQ